MKKKWKWSVAGIMVLCLVRAGVFWFLSHRTQPFENAAKLYVCGEDFLSTDQMRFVAPFTSIDTVNFDMGLYLKVTFKSADDTLGVPLVNGPVINGEQKRFQQCGYYRFEIVVDGQTTVIDDFHYTGEKMVTVARGIGWHILILKDSIFEEAS